MALAVIGGVVAYLQHRPAGRSRVHDQAGADHHALSRSERRRSGAGSHQSDRNAPASSSVSSTLSNRNRRAAGRWSSVNIKDRYNDKRIPAGVGRAAAEDRRRAGAVAAVGPRAVDGGRRFWRRVRHLLCRHRRGLFASRAAALCRVPPPRAAAGAGREKRRAVSPSSRKWCFSKSRGSGWPSSVSTKSRSTPSCRSGTSRPTAAGCASATSMSPLDPQGEFRSVEDMLDLVIGSDQSGRQLFLRDVATLARGDQDPPRRLLALRRQAGDWPGHLDRAGRQRRADGRRRCAKSWPR